MKEIQFKSGKNKISANLCLVKNNIGAILFIAGGGFLSKDIYKDLQEKLARNGLSSLSFDFPGVGKSLGKLEESGLKTRFRDSLKAYLELARLTNLGDKKIFVCGRSMGGPIALRLAVERGLKSAILLFPAAYSGTAYSAKFGKEFSAVIKKNNSWKNSKDFSLAEGLKSLLVIYGDKDNVIPPEIQNKFLTIAREKGRAIIIKGMGHNENLWGNDIVSAGNRKLLLNAILNFIKGQLWFKRFSPRQMEHT